MKRRTRMSRAVSEDGVLMCTIWGAGGSNVFGVGGAGFESICAN